MNSMRTKVTLLAVCAMIVSVGIIAFVGAVSVRNLSDRDADRTLYLMCKTGRMDLEAYFNSVEHSVKTVSTLVQGSLVDVSDENLARHVEQAADIFSQLSHQTNGVLTYYYRIDPAISETAPGFWYVNLDAKGFYKHEVTDISKFDTNDTSKLVWFTVPKASKKGIWIPPYVTDNLAVRVLSYNEPVFWQGMFIGVIGIELSYRTLAQEVENIRPYNNGYAFVLDEKGDFIYHPQINAHNMPGKALPPPPKELLGDNDAIRYTYNGVEKDAVWMPLSNGMRLYVCAPVSEINSSWQKPIWDIIYASVVVLLIVGVIIMFLANRITKPLQDLSKAAREADKGNYDFALEYDQDDEIGGIARSFRKLVANVKDQIRKKG